MAHHGPAARSLSSMTWMIGVAAAVTLMTACASQVGRVGTTAKAASSTSVAHPPPDVAAVRSRAVTLTSPATLPSVPDCIAGHLNARFVGGGFGTGDDFGAVVIWNSGAQPCRLHGQVSLAGYYADGSKDHNAVMAHPIVTGFITLPSRMPPPRDGQDQSDYLVAFMMGTERDDRAQPDALCRPHDEGTPSALVLSVGSMTIRTTNMDAGSAQVRSIYGCHGRVLLEDLQGPQR